MDSLGASSALRLLGTSGTLDSSIETLVQYGVLRIIYFVTKYIYVNLCYLSLLHSEKRFFALVLNINKYLFKVSFYNIFLWICCLN